MKDKQQQLLEYMHESIEDEILALVEQASYDIATDSKVSIVCISTRNTSDASTE